ncbi:MAG: hypothetical protein R3B72_38800 [Polyangiaceae bacterium]
MTDRHVGEFQQSFDEGLTVRVDEALGEGLGPKSDQLGDFTLPIRIEVGGRFSSETLL